MPDRPAALTSLACSDCRGEAFLIDQHGRARSCPRCGQLGLVALVDGELVTYREQFSRTALQLERLHTLLRAILDGLAVAIGLSGLFVLVREYVTAQVSLPELPSFLFSQRPALAYFWFSVLVDLYAFYRLEVETSPPVRLRPRPPTAEGLPVSFEALRQQPVTELTGALSRAGRLVIRTAWDLAHRLQVPFVDDRHLFSALLGQGSVGQVFARLGMAPQTVADRASRLLARGRTVEPALGRTVRERVILAYAEARATRHRAIEPLDLLVAVSQSEGRVRDLLDDLGVDTRRLRHVVAWLRINEELRRRWQGFRARAALKPKGIMDRAMTAQATPVLDQFSHDLTALAKVGALPLTVNREPEMAAVLRALEGKANAVLVGNPGVGKTAIVEGIAQRMVTEELPEVLQDKRLVSLSVASLVAGATAMGELEQRFTEILDEVVKAGNVVLFIDNLQNLVGVSSTGGQTLDLSGILAQALSDRRFFVVATTTVQDYSRYIERSGALLSTFEKVEVNELDREGTILVLEAKAGQIEAKHKVLLTYDALEQTVAYADRYLHERFEPQKSIDLLDEVAVAAHRRQGKAALVTAEDVAAVVSEKTHIEVRKVTEGEREKLLHLEERIHRRIVGQDEAVKAVAAALRRARAELRDPKRPIANFLFLGPTGVGKTELAKTVTAVYFGDESSLVRLDMSEYQDPASVYRLIGSPPGFGATEGYLTQAIRRQPFTLVLLDELEKAHPDILNLFLQVMDEGRLTDSAGRTVDFTNAIIIATSNAGTEIIQERLEAGASVEAIKTELVNEQLRRFFRPEFLNRFDGIIVFTPLSQIEIEQIASLLLGQVAEQLEQRGIHLRATQTAVTELAQAGFDPVFGARPLRRAIQERVDNSLANYLLTGKLGRRDVAVLEPGGVIRVEKATAI